MADMRHECAEPHCEDYRPSLRAKPIGTAAMREWRPEDGDTRCQECSGPNPVWWAPNALWNAVVGTTENPRGEGVVLCPSCFCERVGAHLAEVETERDLQKQNTMEALAEADEYSTELDRTVTALDKTLERESAAVNRAEAAESRLATVLALCDGHAWYLNAEEVRAAARGEDDRG